MERLNVLSMFDLGPVGGASLIHLKPVLLLRNLKRLLNFSGSVKYVEYSVHICDGLKQFV